MVGQRVGPLLTAHGSEGSLARLQCGSGPALFPREPWGSTGGRPHQLSGGWHLGAADPRPQCSQAVLGSRRRADREGMSLDRRPADLISEHLIRLCVKASVHSSCTQELWGQEKFFSKNKQRDCEFPDLPSRAGKPSHQEHQPRTAGNARQASTAFAAPSLCINYLQALS